MIVRAIFDAMFIVLGVYSVFYGLRDTLPYMLADRDFREAAALLFMLSSLAILSVLFAIHLWGVLT